MATVRMPSSLQARMTRTAISPRLAMRIFENMAQGSTGARGVPERCPELGRGLNGKERLAELDRVAVLRKHLNDAPRRFRFDFIHQLHGFNDADHLPHLDVLADFDERRRIGRS